MNAKRVDELRRAVALAYIRECEMCLSREETRELLDAAERCAALEAKCTDLDRLLRKLEWRDDSGFVYCPFCRADEHDGHRPDCELAAALATENANAAP